MEDTKTTFTEGQLEAIAEGRLRLARARDGEPIDLRMRPKQQRQLERAKTDGYITFRGSPPDHPVAQLYNLWCDLWKRPFIQVWPGRRWAGIWITAYSCEGGFTESTRRMLQDFLNWKGRRRSDVLGDRFCIGRDISMDEVDAVAAECFRIVSRPDALLKPVLRNTPTEDLTSVAEKAPVLDAYSSRGGWEVWCIHCHDWHKHSRDQGHRVAHCYHESPYRATGYVLRLAGKMTPEVRRRAWAQQATGE